MKKWLLMALVAGLFTPACARADDAGLYDPVAPDGSAFVRFINAAADKGDVTPSINGKDWPAAKAGEIGAYIPVKAGDIAVKAGAATAGQSIGAAAFYTAVYDNNALVVLKDDVPSNPEKALVEFYNFSPRRLSLKTVDGKTDIVAGVEGGKSASREVNGIKVETAIFDDSNAKVADVSALDLQRGNTMSVIVMDNAGGDLQATAAANTTDTAQ